MDLFIIKKIIIIPTRKKKDKTYNNYYSSHRLLLLPDRINFKAIFKDQAPNASVLQSTARFASPFLINSTPTRRPPAPPPPLPHLFICTITDRYQVTGESVNEEAMLAFHVAASLIAAFTAKDDCSRVQRRIFRSALRCDCAAWDLLKRGGSGHHLFTCFQQIAYIIVYVYGAQVLLMHIVLISAHLWKCYFWSTSFSGGFILCRIPVVKDIYFFFSWFASVFLICICFVKLQRWKLSRSPLGNGPGLAGLTTIEWISI